MAETTPTRYGKGFPEPADGKTKPHDANGNTNAGQGRQVPNAKK